LAAAGQGAIVVDNSAHNVTISENNFLNCGTAIHLADLAGWFSNDVLDNNRFVNCANKVVNSPLPRHGDIFVECQYTGTVDSNGGFRVSHGTAHNGNYVVAAAAFCKGNSGESKAMTLTAVDGTNAIFAVGPEYAGRPCRAWLRYTKDPAIIW